MTELGSRLKEAREAKGMSLDDLQDATKIQKRYLVGIEEGKHEMMPGKFYVRAFIKQYCEAVGLDSEEIFDLYKSEVPAVSNQELPELSRVQTKKSLSPGGSKFLDALPKILAVIVIIGVLVLIYVLLGKYYGGTDNTEPQQTDTKVGYDENADAPEPKDETGSDGSSTEKEQGEETEKEDTSKEEEEEEPVQQTLSSVSTSGKNSTFELKGAEEFAVKVASKGETWVTVRDGANKTLFNAMLKDGESKEFDLTDQQSATVIAGRAYETEVFVNDEKLEYALDPSKTITQIITINFMKNE